MKIQTWISLFVAAAIADAALAQTAYPTKSVRILVGAPPGGGTDIVARLMGEKFAAALGQQFVVDNRPGASNTIAADITAKASPDGHTLLTATNTGQVIAPHMIKLGFDPLKDLTPIGLVITVPHALVIGASVKAKDFRELLAQIKAKPDGFHYASSGVGSTQHIAAELFMRATGTKMIHIPYKGSSQAHVDLLGGQVEIMFDTTSSAMGQIKGGKLRALAVTTPKRSAELPDVPTLDELGVKGAEMTTWYAMYVTSGTPAPVIGQLTVEFHNALKLPDVQARLKGLGGEPGTLTRAQFTQMQKTDFERFGRLIREQNIKVE